MYGYLKNLTLFSEPEQEDPFEYEKDEIMWYRYHQGLCNNHAAYRCYSHKVAMCTDCRFCIHTTKVCEITQLVDEMVYVEKAIKTVRNFYKAFEKKVRSNKSLMDKNEVFIEIEYTKKQYQQIFEDYDSMKNPTMEELLEIEEQLFEFRNSIQRGYIYNQLLK